MGNIFTQLESFEEKSDNKAPEKEQTLLQGKLSDSSDFLRVYIDEKTKILSDRRTSKKVTHIGTTNVEKKFRKNASSMQIVHENRMPFLIGYVYTNAKNEYAVKMHFVRASMEKADREILQINQPDMRRLHHMILFIPTNSPDSYANFPQDLYKIIEQKEKEMKIKLYGVVQKLNAERTERKKKKAEEKAKIKAAVEKAVTEEKNKEESKTASDKETEGFQYKNNIVWGVDGSVHSM